MLGGGEQGGCWAFLPACLPATACLLLPDHLPACLPVCQVRRLADHLLLPACLLLPARFVAWLRSASSWSWLIAP